MKSIAEIGGDTFRQQVRYDQDGIMNDIVLIYIFILYALGWL